MNRDADNLADVQWLAMCARRLRQQWPRADVTSIDETALELWCVGALRELTGEEAGGALARAVAVRLRVQRGLQLGGASARSIESTS